VLLSTDLQFRLTFSIVALIARRPTDAVVDLLPTLPIRPAQRSKNAALGKLQSSHRLGYRGFMEQTTVRKPHLKGHFGFATELSPSSRHGCVLYQEPIFQKLSTILDKSAFKPTQGMMPYPAFVYPWSME